MDVFLKLYQSFSSAEKVNGFLMHLNYFWHLYSFWFRCLRTDNIFLFTGNGSMGVSNSLGANTLDVLLCLGLPWFIKTMVNNREPIPLGSGSLFYTILALILAVVALYTTLCISRYTLNRKNGFILIVIYCVFLTAAILLEMFKNSDLKPCLE